MVFMTPNRKCQYTEVIYLYSFNDPVTCAISVPVKGTRENCLESIPASEPELHMYPMRNAYM